MPGLARFLFPHAPPLDPLPNSTSSPVPIQPVSLPPPSTRRDSSPSASSPTHGVAPTRGAAPTPETAPTPGAYPPTSGDAPTPAPGAALTPPAGTPAGPPATPHTAPPGPTTRAQPPSATRTTCPRMYPCPVPTCPSSFKDFGALLRHLQSDRVRTRDDHADPCRSGPDADLFSTFLKPHGVVACPLCRLPCRSAAGIQAHQKSGKCVAPAAQLAIPPPRSPGVEEGGSFLAGSAPAAMRAVASQMAALPGTSHENAPLTGPPNDIARQWAALNPHWLDALPSLAPAKATTPGVHAAPHIFPIHLGLMTDFGKATSAAEKRDLYTLLSVAQRCLCRPYRPGASPAEVAKEARRRARTWRLSGPEPLLREALAAAASPPAPSSRRRRDYRARTLRATAGAPSASGPTPPDSPATDTKLLEEVLRLARGGRFGNVMSVTQDFGLPDDPVETGDRLQELQEPPPTPPPPLESFAGLYGPPVPPPASPPNAPSRPSTYASTSLVPTAPRLPVATSTRRTSWQPSHSTAPTALMPSWRPSRQSSRLTSPPSLPGPWGGAPSSEF